MLPLKLYTLGGLSILRGDQFVSGFVSRKVEALLVYLAYERREHQREWLATLLWDDLPRDSALGNLRTALSNLSRQLDEYLLISRQKVMMNPDADCWIDSLALLETIKASGGGLNASSAHQLSSTLRLYKGEFLAGFHLRGGDNFETWRMTEAEHLQADVLGAFQRLVQYALDHSQYQTGIDYAREMLAIDPLSEVAHRSLILLLARSGQRNAALAQYNTCVRLLHDELGVEPEPETLDLFARLQSELSISEPEPRTLVHLPTPSTPFINRPTELQQVVERLRQPGCRLLTIVGAGGMGKTRLALQAASDVAEDFRDGVFFVSFAQVQQGQFLPVEIARTIGFTPQSIQDPMAELIAYLTDREMLLVLDNFEEFADHADQLSALLSRAPSVRLLITSRVWLNLPEEWGLIIDGMSYPSHPTPDASGFESIQLFASCAQRVSPSFSLTRDLDAAVTICRKVEGMPLSIELAAAWLRVIPVTEIAEQISLKFLGTSGRSKSARHRSAEAVFETSWKMLTTAEANALMKLSVFRGAFDRQSAHTIAGADLPILASLLEKSLIRRADGAYYTMHELLRQYAFEQLTACGEADEAQTDHLTYFVDLTSDPDSHIHGEQQTRWLERLEREHDNLCTAITWSLEKNTPETRELGLRLAASIWEFWLMRGHITEGRQWLELLLDATQGTISEARGAATQGAGYLAWIQGESDRAEALHREGLSIRQAIGDKAGMGGSLSNLGVIAWSRGDFTAARDFYEQALAVRREANYPIGLASVLSNLSLLMQDQSEYAEAITFAEQAWSIFKELDDLQGMVHVLYNIGAMHYDRGDLHQARQIQDEALVLARQLGDKRVVGGLLLNLGMTLIGLGDRDAAHSHLQESLSLMTQVGDKQHIALVKRGLAQLALVEGHLDEATALIDDSLSILRQPKGDVYLGQALVTKGEILRAQGNLSGAVALLRDGLEVLVAIKKPAPIAEALYGLGRAVLQQGDIPWAAALIRTADGIAHHFNLQLPNRPGEIDREAMLNLETAPQVEPFDPNWDASNLGFILDLIGVGAQR